MKFLQRFVSTLALAAGCNAAALAAEPVIVGWLERVTLGADGPTVSAKLDTGADFPSLHAGAIRWIKREDGDWVVFEVAGADGRTTPFERRVVRVARIRTHDGVVRRRPVVLIDLCLGNVRREIEVNLTDRGSFTQPLLVGRSFLAEGFAVDSGRTYTVEPACGTGSGK